MASLISRNYGIACSRPLKPVWRRSRNITQTLGVMSKTAKVASAKNPTEDGASYKSEATLMKANRSGGSAAVSYQNQPL
jgi:hypothetical protein